jgi:O-Antigen ligase
MKPDLRAAPAVQPRVTHAGAPLNRAETTAVQRLSFAILIAFLFMIFSRVFDIHLTWLHLPGISYRLVGIFLLITGTFLMAFRDRIGRCVLGFTVCFLAAILFSIWRRGSLQVLTDQWLVGLVVFTATASLIPDFRQYILSAKAIALAILVLTITCLALGNMDSGRLFMDSGRFSNPNEMAQALLLGMPFWWALCSNSRSLPARLLGLASLGLMLYVISKTGSRGALISLVVIAGLMFFRASAVEKMKLFVAAAVLLAIGALTLPAGLRTRYQTFFSLDEPEAMSPDGPAADSPMLESAVASTYTRRAMLIRSLVVTLKHPLLGVGPGNFMVAENEMAQAEGRRQGAWVGTHNSFTQVSSECGIPAFLFYCGIVALSFQKSTALYRRTKQNPQFKAIGTHALALNYSLIAFIVTGLFVHAAYTALLPVLAGLTVSLARIAEPLLASERSVPATQPPVWTRGYRSPASRLVGSPARSA